MEAPKEKKKKGSWRDTLRFIIIALFIVIPLRLFVAEPFIVSGHSMDPTFQDGEYLIIDRLSYNFKDPARGDVIVFRYPNNPSVYYIKRIIGLPNETVSIANEKVHITTVAGKTITLDEGYLVNNNMRGIDMKKSLGATEYFVLGDNRPVSSDSRFWGPLDKKYIIGTPLISVYPFNTAGTYPGVHHFDE